MRKIVYVSHDSGLTGAPRSLLDMLGSINGIYESIVIIPTNGDIENYLNELGIRYYVYPFLNDVFYSNNKADITKLIRNNYKAAQEIARLLKYDEVSLVHSNTSAVNVGIFLAHFLNVPHIWHIRENVEEGLGLVYSDQAVKKQLFECSDCVITISHALKEFIYSKYGIDSTCIHDGIKADKHRICASEMDHTNALITGTIMYSKGQFDAIRAIEILRNRGINIKLTIIGFHDETYLWLINEYIKRKGLADLVNIVEFAEDISSYRSSADLSLTCSKCEALGRSTVEGMFAGEFSIGTNCAGTAEIIGDDGERGFTYSFGNATELADRIAEYINLSEEERNKIIENAYKYACYEYSIENYGEKIKHIYDDILTKNVSNRNKCIEKIVNEVFGREEDIKTITHKQTRNISYSSLINGRSLEKILVSSGYRNISIYGMGKWGRKLYTACDRAGIEIKAVFDKGTGYEYDIMKSFMPFYNIGECDFNTEVIIVCVEKWENQIIDELNKVYSFPVIGLSQLLVAN